MIRLLVLVLAGLNSVAFAVETSEIEQQVEDAPPLVKKAVEDAPALQGISVLGDSRMLLGLRMDAAFNGGGGTLYQGFSIPSVRLTAWGQAARYIGYRLSLGQTREFSTVMLPQIMPVEAYVNLGHASSDFEASSHLRLRLGLFTPSFNPWWSPDLSDVPMPDYNQTHTLLFLSRDIGAEIVYEPVPGKYTLFVGAFNGSGIFSLNTNNSKAFTGGARASYTIGGVRFTTGVSGLVRMQADSSSVNYRSDAVGNVYLGLEIPGTSFRFFAEGMWGSLNDSVRSATPVGGALSLQFPLFRALHLFSKAEYLMNSGTGSGYLRNGQIGPVIELDKNTNAFFFYQYLDNGGSIDSQGWVRLRLVM